MMLTLLLEVKEVIINRFWSEADVHIIHNFLNNRAIVNIYLLALRTLHKIKYLTRNS